VIALGIDPGTARCGFGVVALDDGRLRLIDAGVIRTESTGSDADRLRALHDALTELLTLHHPHRVGVERLFFQRNVQTAMAVGQARGVALLAAAQAGLLVDEPTPNEVKQAVCGNGAADKPQVAAMVARLLGIAVDGVTDDATDALAVAIGCAYRGVSSDRVAAAR
jgi:crossover junction endodeoxyribonuclease RuvC